MAVRVVLVRRQESLRFLFPRFPAGGLSVREGGGGMIKGG